MRSKSFIFILFVLIPLLAIGQKKYKNSNLGLGLIHFSYEGYQIYDAYLKGIDSIPVNGRVLPLTAYWDWNYPMINIKTNSSLGINPGLTFSANGRTYGLTIPVFVNFKYGTDAQIKKRGSNLGFACSLGYTIGGYTSEDFEFLFNKPVFMTEVSFQTGYLLNKIRFMGAIGGFTSDNPPQNGLMGGYHKMSSYFGIFYSFNFLK